MGDIALKVEGLTKEYRLGTIGYGTMREDLQTWWARLRGKEDPNSLVTASHHSESDQKHFLALDGINFEIKKGDRVGIIGKNGAGKSTLLKVLSRITSPTKGNLYVNGRIGSLLEVGTGFHQELTGRENIYLNGSILGMKRREIDMKLDEIVDFAGIEKFIDTPVKRYSSGMFVRLGFAVAAHLEPEILIVDEVLAVGDVDFQKKAIGKMKEVSNNEGRTVLFVSHNLSSVRQLCNNGILLDKGQVTDIGNIEAVIESYINCTTSLNSFFEAKHNSEKIAEITKVYLECDGIKNKTSSDNSKKNNIICEYKINKRNKGLAVLCELFNSQGECIFGSSSRDNDINYFSSLFYEKGIYKSSIEIPSDVLLDDTYYVSMHLVLPNVEIYDSAESCLMFKINDVKSPVAVNGEKRKGIILPILDWSTEKI